MSWNEAVLTVQHVCGRDGVDDTLRQPRMRSPRRDLIRKPTCTQCKKPTDVRT